MSSRSWNVFSGPGDAPQTAAEHFVASPFTRLARVHALQIAGDALIALALADSLFFSIDPTAARGKVALYLLLTMAPFAVVAPLIGPWLDRATNRRRLMVVGMSMARVLVGISMMRHLDSLWLFPEAFLMLILSKGYMIAKSAIVPTTVSTDQQLVEANSKLSIITGAAGFMAAVPGWILGQIGGPEWIVGFAVIVFSAGAIAALRLPATAAAPEPPGKAEEDELRSRGIVLAATAMGLLRGIVGFLLFLLAFDFRSEHKPTWQLGAAIVASVVGSFIGSLLAPRVRQTTQEEDILIGSLLIATVGGLLAAWAGGLPSALLVTFCVGFCANTGKLAFDSIVQRDAPDANRGRTFARFETRFQIIWVVGAFIPVVIPIPSQLGFLIVGLTAGFAGVTYWIGRRDAARGRSRRRHISAKPEVDDDVTVIDDRTEIGTGVTDLTEELNPPPGPDRRPRGGSRRPTAAQGNQRPPPGVAPTAAPNLAPPAEAAEVERSVGVGLG